MPKKGRKKNKEPKITYYEALLGYKISLKEKELEDTNFALKELIEKNENSLQRNQRLKENREYYMKKALRDYKQFTNQLDSQGKCEKEDVLSEMKNLWKKEKEHNDELIDIRIQIKQVENQISQTKKEIKIWNDFHNRGTHELDMQIKLLNQEIEDMRTNFEIMSNHIANQLVQAREYITHNTEQLVAKEHKSAAEKIFKEMDKYTVQMMHDNKWMAEKVKTYTENATLLNAETSQLEKENLELMRNLFDCDVSDLKIIKNAFQTQFLDNENIELNSILDIDLDRLDTLRPKSALDKAVEKVMKFNIPEEEEEEEDNGTTDEVTEEDDDTMNDSFSSIEPQKRASYVNLGPYDFKALNLRGFKKPIYKPKAPSVEEVKAEAFKGDEWPVTQEMLNFTLNVWHDQD